ncbi:hypothetical protein B0H14DRAFT_2601014 [Mycena olivaceomarginata]|nr:hypothetical protein B0H14DRAFT_2601014 [Mycena olivaceomarginata]
MQMFWHQYCRDQKWCTYRERGPYVVRLVEEAIHGGSEHTNVASRLGHGYWVYPRVWGLRVLTGTGCQFSTRAHSAYPTREPAVFLHTCDIHSEEPQKGQSKKFHNLRLATRHGLCGLKTQPNPQFTVDPRVNLYGFWV